MMGDDSDDDKPLLFQFKNSKGSVQAKCSARNGATNTAQKSMEKLVQNVKGLEDEDDDKPLQLTVSKKHFEKAAQKVVAVLDINSKTAPEQPLNGLTMRMAARNLASVKVYTKRKKLLGDQVRDNVVAKKMKISTRGTSSEENEDDHDDDDIPLLLNAGFNRKKHSAGVSLHDVAGSCKTSITFSKAVVCIEANEENKDADGLRVFDEKEGTPAIADTNGSKDENSEENDSDDSDVDDAIGENDTADDANGFNKASDTDESDDANGSRDKSNDSIDIIQHNDINNADAEDTDDEVDCSVPLSKHSDPKEQILAEKSGNGMDDPRLPSGAGHKKSKSSNASSKVAVGLNLIIKEEEEDDDLPLSLIIKEEEEDDDLPLSKLSDSKRRQDPGKRDVTFRAKKNTVKLEDRNNMHNGCDSRLLGTKTQKFPDKKGAEKSKLSDVVTERKLQESDKKKENDVKDVPTGKTPCTNKRVSAKGTDLRAEVSCESRRQQLLALSKSLEDTDSEQEKEEEDESQEEDVEVEEEDDTVDEEEDEEKDNDMDYNGFVATKHPVVAEAGRSRVMKVTSASSKARLSVKSRARTPSSSSKSAKKFMFDDKVDDDEVGDDDDDSEEEEEGEGSENEDEEWEEEEEDDEEYGVSRAKKRKKSKGQTSSLKKHKQKEGVRPEQPKKRAQKLKDAPGAGGGQKWTTLEHNGVIFPPFYQPHGVKMLYEGKAVDLNLEQEEVATMFAVMKETDYASKPKFLANFWNDWKTLLGPKHTIQNLEGCDFMPIYEWHLAEKEKKQKLTAEEKKAVKEDRLKQEEKYMWAIVDGVTEKVGNFRVEPPGLFRGRGEHPKMGKVKRRIYPEDIVINIGADSPVPECPLPGHSWKEVRNDNTVTWLAYWNDPINTKEQKYVFLSPSSTLKGQSDKEKYEKARVLKDYISDIRKTYTENFASSDPTTRQIAIATYLIDQLALRAGNEKDDDEADTVGCCSLKVEHVSLIPPSSLEFDFLGKDSIRYLNSVPVVKPVYEAIGDFKKGKIKGMDLFDKLDTNKLNAHLKNIMPQLTAKVFRTYNASITLDTLLIKTDGTLIPEKIAAYQLANKEVAILCNHQRSVSKSHGTQMEKLEVKLAELSDLLDELEEDLERAKKGKPPGKDADGNPRKTQNSHVLEKKIFQTNQKMERMKLDMKTKEDLKTVALGTSKINYMDPRITVAWCKQHEVPIEKIFNKSLLAKFAWAMDVDMSFHF